MNFRPSEHSCYHALLLMSRLKKCFFLVAFIFPRPYFSNCNPPKKKYHPFITRTPLLYPLIGNNYHNVFCWLLLMPEYCESSNCYRYSLKTYCLDFFFRVLSTYFFSFFGWLMKNRHLKLKCYFFWFFFLRFLYFRFFDSLFRQLECMGFLVLDLGPWIVGDWRYCLPLNLWKSKNIIDDVVNN